MTVPRRIKVAIHVLRGRPVVYRMHLLDTLVIAGDTRNALVMETTIEHLERGWNGSNS